MAQQNIQLLFVLLPAFRFCFVFKFSPTPTKSCVSLAASKEETIETAEKTISTEQRMKPKLATKVSLITLVCKGESSVHDGLFCRHHYCTKERERRYSETRSRSNVSGAYTY